jgi:integrase
LRRSERITTATSLTMQLLLANGYNRCVIKSVHSSDKHLLSSSTHDTKRLVTLINNLQKPGARKDGRSSVLSGRTVVYIYNVLRNVFTQAKEWKLIKVNPMDGVRKPKFEKHKANFYEADEARAVIKVLYSEPMMWRSFMLGSLLGGCRRGEMIVLEWTDVLFDQAAIHIQKSISLVQGGHVYEKGTKNDEDRFVDLPEWYMKELKQKLKSEVWEAGDREYLFHGGTGKPLYHTTPTRWWREFVANHGLRYIRLHDLRHSSATLLIEAGASMKAIQERLGHKQKQTTDDIYAHDTKKVSRELANKFNQFDPS